MVSSSDVLNKISKFHIWNESYKDKSINWKQTKHAVVALLRVYPLVQPQALPILDEYGSCKSIVDLGQDVPMGELLPVIQDVKYESMCEEISKLLEN